MNLELQRPHFLQLFQLGDFTLHSGQKSRWKIECDALQDADWETLAAMIAERQQFSEVVGVPRGGIKPALALTRYKTPGDFPVLVVDDVLTTGESILRTLDNLENAVGWVVFARGACPPRVQALFQMPTAQYREAIKMRDRVERLHMETAESLNSMADSQLEGYSIDRERNKRKWIELDLLRALLRDAVEKESPLDLSAGEDAVIERLREMEEKP